MKNDSNLSLVKKIVQYGVVVINGVVIGLELYFLMEGINMPLYACMGFVALGELIAMAVGYAVFMIIIRNKGAMNAIAPEKHQEAKF